MPVAQTFLGLGTNLGDRTAQLASALSALTDYGVVVARSHVYESAPMYVTDQPAFLNMCVQFDTDLAALALLATLKQIEQDCGRVQTFRNGPRAIDIDILAYDALIIDTPDLLVPHIGMAERAFVLAPLADIAPDWRNPRNGLRVIEMLDQLGSDGISLFGSLP